MEALLMVVTAALVAIGAWIGHGQRADRRHAWRRAAEECGLAELGGDDPLTGRAGRLRVRIAPEAGGEDSPPIISIAVDGGDDDLVPVTAIAADRATFFQRKTAVATGDPSFDGAVVVSGDAVTALAAMDEKTRTVLKGLVEEAQLRFDFAALKAAIAEPSGSEEIASRRLAEVLRRLLDAAARLRAKPDVAAAIAGNARTDPVAGVRERNLVALATSFAGDAVTKETLRAATGDASDAVRVRAALLLGEEGVPVLREIAAREGADDLPAAEALRALGQRLARAEADAILRRALRRRRVQTALACLDTLAGSREPEAVTAIARVMAVEQGEVAVAAASALGKASLASGEGPLLDALSRDEREVRVAAAEALGRMGTAAAVLPLQEAEAKHARDAELRRAAREAVAAIQSRLRGASPGQLSLAAPAAPGGHLSLADDPRGRLSVDVTDAERGSAESASGPDDPPTRSRS